MSSEWEVTDTYLLLRRSDSAQPFQHSARVKGTSLSLRYWDYLAWAVQRQPVKNMLLLGLGGGTVLQLLQRWGVTPTCLAVEIDPTMTSTVKQHGWLDYPGLTIVHADARQFIQNGNLRKFDTVIVDLYDECGFVQEVYRPPLIQRLASFLSPQGILLMHCLDPAVKYLALNLVLPRNIPSTSYTVASDLGALAMEVEVYPLWSSALVLAHRSKEKDDVPEPELREAKKASVELQWLSKFLAARRRTVQDLSNQCARLDDAYTYTVLERLDAEQMQAFASSIPPEVYGTLQKSLGMKETSSDQRPDQVWERHADGLKPLSASSIQGALIFMQLLEMHPGPGPQVEQLIETISQIAHEPSANPALRYMESFALAWGGRWNEALAVIEQVK